MLSSGSCYRINGSPLQCTPTSLRPDYNATLTAAVEAGLPETMLHFLPTHLIQTPTVIVVGMVFMFLALPLFSIAAVAAWVPSLQSKITLKTSNWIWCSGLFCFFWGWLLCLSISLSQENQFHYFVDAFTSVARVSTRTNTVGGFQRAVLGSSFTQRELFLKRGLSSTAADWLLCSEWVGYAFITICLPIAYVQHCKRDLVTSHQKKYTDVRTNSNVA